MEATNEGSKLQKVDFYEEEMSSIIKRLNLLKSPNDFFENLRKKLREEEENEARLSFIVDKTISLFQAKPGNKETNERLCKDFLQKIVLSLPRASPISDFLANYENGNLHEDAEFTKAFNHIQDLFEPKVLKKMVHASKQINMAKVESLIPKMNSLPRAWDVLEDEYGYSTLHFENISTPKNIQKLKVSGKAAKSNGSLFKDPEGNFNIFGTNGDYFIVVPDEKLTIKETGEIPVAQPCTQYVNSNIFLSNPSLSLFLFAEQETKSIRVFNRKKKEYVMEYQLDGSSCSLFAHWLNDEEFIWSNDQGTQSYSIHQKGPTDVFYDKEIIFLCLCPSESSEFVIVGTSNKKVIKIEFPSKRKKILWETGLTNEVYSVDLSLNKELIAVGIYTEGVRVLNEKTGAILGKIGEYKFTNTVYTVRWTPDGLGLLVLSRQCLVYFSFNPEDYSYVVKKRLDLPVFNSCYLLGMEVHWETGTVLVGNNNGEIFRLKMEHK